MSNNDHYCIDDTLGCFDCNRCANCCQCKSLNESRTFTGYFDNCDGDIKVLASLYYQHPVTGEVLQAKVIANDMQDAADKLNKVLIEMGLPGNVQAFPWLDGKE